MSIELNPVELAFRREISTSIWMYDIANFTNLYSMTGPFTQQVTQRLHLKNPSQDPVAFKVSDRIVRAYTITITITI